MQTRLITSIRAPWRAVSLSRGAEAARRTIGLALAALTLAPLATAADGRFYDPIAHRPVVYAAPDWADVTQLQMFEMPDGTRQIGIALAAPLPARVADRFVVEVYFDTSAEGLFDRALVVNGGNCAYASTPVLPRGAAGVVDVATSAVLDLATWSRLPNGLRIAFDPSAVEGRDPSLVTIRYLPIDIDLAHVAGGFSACVVDALVLDPRLAQAEILFPTMPGEAPNLGTHGHLSTNGAPHHGSIPLVAGPPDSGGGYSCPPAPNTVPTHGDINNDNIDDWDYPLDEPIAGSPQHGDMIDLYGLDLPRPDPTHPADTFLLVVGHDANGNGQLDPDEIISPIGQCTYSGGQNELIEIDGSIIWLNWDPTTGASTTYVYDTTSGILLVIRDGQVVYEGPPEGWSWYGYSCNERGPCGRR